MQHIKGGWIILILFFAALDFVQANDVLCDRQLEYFERSLRQRKRWAIDGKKDIIG